MSVPYGSFRPALLAASVALSMLSLSVLLPYSQESLAVSVPEQKATMGGGESEAGAVGSAQGDLSYGYGFELPPSRLTPSVSLSYSSSSVQASDVGFGWSLSGFSLIERDVRNGARDQNVAASENNVKDGFVLRSGNGRTTLQHTDATGSGYRLYGDGSQTSYRLDATTNKWTVTGYNGITTTYAPLYGRAAHAGDGVGTFLSLAASDTLVWGIERVEDRSGNVTHYIYEVPTLDSGLSSEVAAQVMPQVVGVEYGGNATLAPMFRVRLLRSGHGVPSEYRGMLPVDYHEVLSAEELSSSGRWGGVSWDEQGSAQRLVAVATEAANGTTDPSRHSRATRVSRFWRLNHAGGNADLNQWQVNLTSIEAFGFDKNGVASAEPPVRFEYYGWGRTFTEVSHRLPGAEVMTQPNVSGLSGGSVVGGSELFPSLQTTLSNDHRALLAAGLEGARDRWPQQVGSDRFEYVGPPGEVQGLRDMDQDGIPDFVNWLSDPYCLTHPTVAQVLPSASYLKGAVDGSLSSTPQALNLARPLGLETTNPTSNVFCGWDIHRGIFPLSADSGYALTPNHDIEGYVLDIDGDGLADVVRKIGTMGVAAPGGADDRRWLWFRRLPGVPARYETVGRTMPTAIDPDSTIRGVQQMRSNAFFGARLGIATVNEDAGSLADVTGDGILDRVVTVRYEAYRDESGAPVSVPEGWAVAVYPGKLEGSPQTLTFGSPFIAWTRAEAGLPVDHDHPNEEVPPSPSGSVTAPLCQRSDDLPCESGFDTLQTEAQVDMNGDGLVDILTTQPRYERWSTPPPRVAQAGYQLTPARVLVNYGRGYHLQETQPNALIALGYTHADGLAQDGTRHSSTRERLIDFNGDGLPDYLGPNWVQLNRNGRLGPRMRIEVPMHEGHPVYFTDEHQASRLGLVETTSQLVVPMSGDGRPDIVKITSPTTYSVFTDADPTAAPGRLKAVSNGLGAQTRYHYQTIASALDHIDPITGLREGIPHSGWVLHDTVTTSQGLTGAGPEYQQSYQYADAHVGRSPEKLDATHYVSEQPTFLGFGTVTTISSTGQSTRAEYDFSEERPGLLTRVSLVSSTGQLLDRTTNSYFTYGDAASRYYRLQSRQSLHNTENEFGGGYSGQESRTEYRYGANREATDAQPDLYLGAPTRVIEHRNLADPSADLIQDTDYIGGPTESHTGGGLVLAVEQRVLSTTGTRLRVVRYAYDDQAFGSRTYSKGLVTQTQTFPDVSRMDAPLTTRTEYDSRGLVVAVTSPEGRRSSQCYDAFGLYAIKTSTPVLGGKSLVYARSETEYDLTNGAVLERRGPNGLATSAVTASDCNTDRSMYWTPQGVPQGVPAATTAQETPTLLADASTDAFSRPTTSWVESGSAVRPSGYQRDSVTAGVVRESLPGVLSGYPQAPNRPYWLRVNTLIPNWVSGTSGTPPSAPAFLSRTFATPTSYVEYDGLGRAIRSYGVVSRDEAGYHLSPLGEASYAVHAVGGVVNGMELSSSSVIDSGQSSRMTSIIDGLGRPLTASAVTSMGSEPETQSTMSYQYGIYGDADAITAPNPMGGAEPATAAILRRGNYNEPTEVASPDARGSRVRRVARSSAAGAAYAHPVTIHSDWMGVTLGETEVDPIARTVTARRFTNNDRHDVLTSSVKVDELGQTIAVTNDEGQITTYRYDDIGRKTQTRRYNTQSDQDRDLPLEWWEYGYDRDGLSTQTAHNIPTPGYGPPSTRLYRTVRDGFSGRVVQELNPPAADASLIAGYGGTTVSYETNPNSNCFGQANRIASASRIIDITCNGRGQVETETHTINVTWPDGRFIADRYSKRHEVTLGGLPYRTTLDLGDGAPITVQTNVDRMGRVRSLIEDPDGARTSLVRYTYGAAGQVTQIDDVRGGRQTRTYDAVGRVTQSRLEAGGSTWQQDIGLDPRTGAIAQVQTRQIDGRVDTVQYRYDDTHRLTRADNDTLGYHLNMDFGHDGIGQGRSRIAHVDEIIPGRDLRDWTYQYNEATDRTQLNRIVDGSGNAVHQYQYNTAGEMIKSDATNFTLDPRGEMVETQNASYVQDPDRQRSDIRIKRSGPDPVLVQEPGIDFTYQEGADPTNPLRMVRTRAERIVGQIGRDGSTTTIRHHDVSGNLALVRSEAAGTTTTTPFAFTPYGETLTAPTTTAERAERRTFQGGGADPTGSGLIRFGVRDFNTITKLFNNRDPGRTGITGNGYSFANNNPIMFSDPSGYQTRPGTMNDNESSATVRASRPLPNFIFNIADNGEVRAAYPYGPPPPPVSAGVNGVASHRATTSSPIRRSTASRIGRAIRNDVARGVNQLAAVAPLIAAVGATVILLPGVLEGIESPGDAARTIETLAQEASPVLVEDLVEDIPPVVEELSPDLLEEVPQVEQAATDAILEHNFGVLEQEFEECIMGRCRNTNRISLGGVVDSTGRILAFEEGAPYYPGNYPSTAAQVRAGALHFFELTEINPENAIPRILAGEKIVPQLSLWASRTLPPEAREILEATIRAWEVLR